MIAVHDLALGWVKQQARWEQIEGTPIYCSEGREKMYETGISFVDVTAVQSAALSEFIEAFEADQPT